MLDKILNPKLLRTKPILAMPTGFFFVLLAVVSSLIIFPTQASIVMVALSSLFMLPYVIKIFEFDELDVDIDDTKPEQLGEWVKKCLRDGYSPKQIKDNLIKDNMDKPYDLMYDLAGVDEEYVKRLSSSNFFTRHRQTMMFYTYLFLGSAIAFILLYGLLGENEVSRLFENQLDVISPGPGGDFRGGELFNSIVSNNLKITVICVLLSLLYGSGAIFILMYNSSIAGVMYGDALRSILWGSSELYPNLLNYLPHTTIEIFAYLLAAISGGIISKATVGSQPGSTRIWLKDGLQLFVFSVILILIGAWVEVQVIN
ncbi:MAG: stage II sporulation protein M [Candidatus Altiarchaeota archaeon]